MERAVSSSTYPSGRDLNKEMTQLKILTYLSPILGSNLQQIGGLLKSEYLNYSESTVKSDSAVKANVSSDSHKRKLQ